MNRYKTEGIIISITTGNRVYNYVYNHCLLKQKKKWYDMKSWYDMKWYEKVLYKQE